MDVRLVVICGKAALPAVFNLQLMYQQDLLFSF